MFKQVVINLFGCILVGFFLVFIGINWVTGCEDWSQPNCVSPLQLIGVK